MIVKFIELRKILGAIRDHDPSVFCQGCHHDRAKVWQVVLRFKVEPR